MTAALALYDDLIAFDDALIESTAEKLGDESLVSLLLLRFRSFLSCRYGESEALLLEWGTQRPMLHSCSSPRRARRSFSTRIGNPARELL